MPSDLPSCLLIDQVYGVTVGEHPMICRMFKGAFNARPPLPRYAATWNVQKVLHYLDNRVPCSFNPLPLT